MEATTLFNPSPWIRGCKEYLEVKDEPSLYYDEIVRHYFVSGKNTFYVTEDKPKNRLLLSQIIAISQNCLRTNINIEDLETIKNVLLHLKEFKKEKELPNDKKIQRLESAIWEFEGKIKLIQLENENEIMQELVSKTHVLLMSVFGNTTMGDSIRKFEKETRGNQLLHLQAEQGRLKCHLLQLTEELKNVMPGNMQQSIEARLANLQISEASLHNMEK